MRVFLRPPFWIVPLCLAIGACVAGSIEPTMVIQDNDAAANGNATADGNPHVNPNDSNTVVVGNGNNSNAPANEALPGVAMYWGTGNDAGVDPDLSTLCSDGDISIIILSFVDAVASNTQNANGNPSMAINDCPRPFNAANPTLGNCPALGTKITACQAAGKKVLLSLGGAGAAVSFQSDAEATSYATLLWNMFLGGAGNVRPFGTATLDGIDLDIENGPTTGYAALVLGLRQHMAGDTSRKYLITAAPQCPFPDSWIGPDGTSFDGSTTLKNTALSLALTSFDHLFVQFYNNFCRFNSLSDFTAAFAKWSSLGTGQPKVWVGLPVLAKAAGDASFVAGQNLPQVLEAVGTNAHFGGFMFWDAGYDAETLANGNKPMRAWAAEALANFF